MKRGKPIFVCIGNVSIAVYSLDAGPDGAKLCRCLSASPSPEQKWTTVKRRAVALLYRFPFSFRAAVAIPL